MWLEDQVSKGTMSPETASETSEQAKSLIFSRGIFLPDITESVLNTDPEPAFFSEANPALQWSSCAAIQSIPPELNDTYSALDEYFGHADVSSQTFAADTVSADSCPSTAHCLHSQARQSTLHLQSSLSAEHASHTGDWTFTSSVQHVISGRRNSSSI